MGWEVAASGIGRKWKRDMGDLISLRPITLPVLCPRFARDRQLRFQLDSGREHPPRDMSSSETGHVMVKSMYVDPVTWLWRGLV